MDDLLETLILGGQTPRKFRSLLSFSDLCTPRKCKGRQTCVCLPQSICINSFSSPWLTYWLEFGRTTQLLHCNKTSLPCFWTRLQSIERKLINTWCRTANMPWRIWENAPVRTDSYRSRRRLRDGITSRYDCREGLQNIFPGKNQALACYWTLNASLGTMIDTIVDHEGNWNTVVVTGVTRYRNEATTKLQGRTIRWMTAMKGQNQI